MIARMIAVAALFCCLLFSSYPECTEVGYSRPACVSQETWNEVAPYFLPYDHPMRPTLDRIFSQGRVILCLKTLISAGFIDPQPTEWTRIIVTKHRDLPGYIFKIYLDAQRYHKKRTEYDHWMERIDGARAIAAEIESKGLEHSFKVPRKWIYPVPEYPPPPKEMLRKNFVLVEDDMNIFDDEENLRVWESDWVTEEKLDGLYYLLETLGLHDCAKPHNIPFSLDGRIAFVDTQSAYCWPVAYRCLGKFLSPEMRKYWDLLLSKKKLRQ